MTFRIRNGKRGIAIRLHELEAAIMDVVWKKGLSSFAVADVLHVLERSRDIAYTTVMTTVVRLHQKGLLARTRDGRRYLYSPNLTREEFLNATAREVLDGAVGGPQAFAMLAERVADASHNELDELERVIRERRKELGK